MRKPKIKINFSKETRWTFCGHCGHAVFGSSVASVSGWPKPVKVPKKNSIKVKL